MKKKTKLPRELSKVTSKVSIQIDTTMKPTINRKREFVD